MFAPVNEAEQVQDHHGRYNVQIDLSSKTCFGCRVQLDQRVTIPDKSSVGGLASESPQETHSSVARWPRS